MSNQPRWPSTWTWLHVPIATSPWASEEVSARARTVSSLPWDSAGSWSCVQLKELIWHRLRLRIVSGKSLVSFTKVQGWMQSIASTRRSSGPCWTWSLALALTLTAGISSNQFCKADFLGADFLRADFVLLQFFWFIIYTTIKDARAVLQRHIDHVKWKDCAFSTEQLKGQRWMLGSTPKNCPTNLKKALTVSEMAQVLHFKLVIHCYQENGRRLRQSSKSRVRWSGAQFDAHCDLACVYSADLEEVRELSHWNSEKEAAVIKALLQKFLGSFFEWFFVGLFCLVFFCSHLQLVESTFTAFQLFLLLLCESLSEGLWSRGGGRCDSKTSNLEGSALGIVGGSHWAPSVSWTCGFSKWADGAWRWSSGSKVQRSAHKAFPGHLSYVQLQQLKGGVHPSFPCGESHAREKPGGGRQRASSQTCSGNCVFLK